MIEKYNYTDGDACRLTANCELLDHFAFVRAKPSVLIGAAECRRFATWLIAAAEQIEGRTAPDGAA